MKDKTIISSVSGDCVLKQLIAFNQPHTHTHSHGTTEHNMHDNIIVKISQTNHETQSVCFHRKLFNTFALIKYNTHSMLLTLIIFSLCFASDK